MESLVAEKVEEVLMQKACGLAACPTGSAK